MKIYDNYFQNKSKYLFFILIILLVQMMPNPVKSQDLFGTLPSSPTSYVTKSKVASNGHIYITVWGSGVFRSTDKGKSWNPINTGLTNLNLSDIEFISSTELLVSTMGSGIFKTTSLTNINWVECNVGLTNLNVKSIKSYSGNLVLIGTYGSGIFLSKDKAANWESSSKGLFYKDVTSIESADNGWVVAGTYGGGIYISRDTAKTWSRQSIGLINQFIHDVKRNKLGYLYAASNGRGVYISVNDGIAWAELDTFMTRTQGIDPVPLPDLNTTCITFNKNLSPVFGSRYGGIYADDKEQDFTWIPTRLRGIGVNTMCQNTDSMYSFFPNYAPHSSNNVGEEWTELEPEPLATLAKHTQVLSLNEKEIVAYYDKYVKKTTDEGKTWIVSAPTPAPINKIARDSSGNYYAATTNGLFGSDASLTNWTPLIITTADKTTLNIYDVEVAPNGTVYSTTRLLGEMIDTSIAKYSNDGINWLAAPIPVSLTNNKTPPFQDIGINYNGNIYIAADNLIFYSMNNGVIWDSTSQFTKNIANFSFFRDNTILVAINGGGLYKSTSVNTFQKINSYPASGISFIYVGLNDVIYATGTNILVDAGFSTVEATYMSTDRGTKFININKDFNGEVVGGFAVSNAGDMYMSTSSGMIYRAIDKKNLTIPNLLDIVDNSVNVDVDAIFKWTSSKRAELYQLQISYDEDFIYIWEGVTQLDTTHSLTAKLDPNHKYYWRVRSKNHDAVSSWSEVRTFMSKLKTPVLISPADKAVNVPVYADLVWEDVDGASIYAIQLSKESNFNVIAFEWNSDTATTVSPLLEGKTKYYWRVKASNAISTSNWSAPWSFETVFGPPLLISPADKSIGKNIAQLMVWSKAIDVNEYDIQISEFEDFSALVMDSASISNMSVISDVMEYDKTYYWRVRSRKVDVVSAWSLVWSFRTGYSPVILTAPVNDAINVAINTKFIWEKHPTQNKYEIEAAKSTDFTNNVIFEEIDNLLTYSADNLESYQEYFWRVRVKSDENIGVWSAQFKFKTQVDKITLRFPDNNTINHPVSISFLWFGTKGASTYHLQIANDDLFNDLIFSKDTISGVSHKFSQLNPGSKYYWRVRAVSPEGVGEWSEVWIFTTGSNIPILMLPENGNEKVVNPITFQWQPVTGALRYELNVSESTEFAQTVINKTDITINQFITSELGFPKTYYWRLRAVTADGPTSWSQVWSFGTKDPSGVDDIIFLSKTEIYPNPADKSINIKLMESAGTDVYMKILDMTGRIIFSEKVFNTDNQINWDCSALSPGLYFFTIQSSDKVFKGEIIIKR